MGKHVISERRHASFPAFVESFHRIKTSHSMIFRGQRDPTWKLEPSILRLARRAGHQTSTVESARALASFKASAPYLGLDMTGKSDADLYAIGQHHGLQTPLLDWTRSPYVALFFAFADLKLNGPAESDLAFPSQVAIWSLDMNAAAEATKPARSSANVVYVQPHDASNRRLLAQQGGFTLASPVRALEDIPEVRGYLEKHLLPTMLMDEVLLHLNRMNINYRTLYPDLGGASLHGNLDGLMPSYSGISG